MFEAAAEYTDDDWPGPYQRWYVPNPWTDLHVNQFDEKIPRNYRLKEPIWFNELTGQGFE